MNIYFINPKDFDSTGFPCLLDMLKVTSVINLINKNEEIDPEEYIDREFIDYRDLSYIKPKPQSQYLHSIAKGICETISLEEEWNNYTTALLYCEDAVMPFTNSNAGNFVENLKEVDDPNCLILYNSRLIFADLVKILYKEFFQITGLHDYEQKIPLVHIESWAKYPESNIVSVWRRTTKEEKKHMHYYIRDAKTHRTRPMTYTEKKRISYGSFCPVTMDDLDKVSKFSYYGIHYDPICYLYKMMDPLATDNDEMRLKIDLAHLLLNKEAQYQMHEKLERLAEARREMEYQEWLHGEYIDDTDYDRETFYTLGGDDYDRFKENGGSIDDMMDGMGF